MREKEREKERTSRSALCNDHRRSAASGPCSPVSFESGIAKNASRRVRLSLCDQRRSHRAAAREKEIMMRRQSPPPREIRRRAVSQRVDLVTLSCRRTAATASRPERTVLTYTRVFEPKYASPVDRRRLRS